MAWISDSSSPVREPSSQAAPVIPSPKRAGVLGMARTTRTFPPIRSLRSPMVRPGAREITIWPGRRLSRISPNTCSKYWGFTASMRYSDWAAHWLLDAAWGTPVRAVTASIFSL